MKTEKIEEAIQNFLSIKNIAGESMPRTDAEEIVAMLDDVGLLENFLEGFKQVSALGHDISTDEIIAMLDWGDK